MKAKSRESKKRYTDIMLKDRRDDHRHAVMDLLFCFFSLLFSKSEKKEEEMHALLSMMKQRALRTEYMYFRCQEA